VPKSKESHGLRPWLPAKLVERNSRYFAGLLLDVFDDVADGLKLFRVFVRNLDGKFLLERHDELDGIERIRTEILDE
jgi:hypothetical protein